MSRGEIDLMLELFWMPLDMIGHHQGKHPSHITLVMNHPSYERIKEHPREISFRLTDGESDSNQQPRGKTRPGRRGEKGAKGGRTRNEGVNGRTGKVGKRISPNVSIFLRCVGLYI